MARASRRRGDAARRHADTMWFILFEARPAGLSFQQLVRASGLSTSQVRAGLAMLKDIIAENGWPPLSCNRADGYQLGAPRDVLEAYERSVISEKLTEFGRFIKATILPHADAHPGDKWIKHIVAQMNSIESTLDLIKHA
ncbi:RacP protein [Streptomyces enissocaesilis]|uniref:RacP protein n=1 Tax=Streptomyces enissocaesilis TaxID=332589 RepID=A0ABN3XNC0_9ACTN